MTIATPEQLINAIGRGDMVIVIDDEGRENEGDLFVAAEMITEAQMAFMIRYTSGIICLPIEGARLDELELPQMVARSTDSRRTAFTESIDAKSGTSTGISAAALSEIMNDDGTVSRLPELERFAEEHDLLIGTVADLIAHRRATEDQPFERVVGCRIPTKYGEFRGIAYRVVADGQEHMAFVMGEMGDGEDVLTRVHSECLTGDVFGSLRCDCGPQLDLALQKVAQEGRGVVLYIRGHEGRGIGLLHKLEAYNLQDEGRDTVEANEDLGLPVDSRDYGVGAQILYDIGVRSMRLLTNNPTKRAGIEGYGLRILSQESLVPEPNEHNRVYLETKAQKLGHDFG